MRNLLATILILFISVSTNANTSNISGKIAKIRFHHHQSNEGWDNNLWFCLDNMEVRGSCGTAPSCGGAMALVASENDEAVVSAILAAKMADKTVKVYVNDNIKFENNCFIQSIDID